MFEALGLKRKDLTITAAGVKMSKFSCTCMFAPLASEYYEQNVSKSGEKQFINWNRDFLCSSKLLQCEENSLRHMVF